MNDDIEHNNVDEKHIEGLIGQNFTDALGRDDIDTVREILANPNTSEVTERYSARMSARDFLVKQKDTLTKLDASVDQSSDLENDIKDFFKNMDADYDEYIVDPYDEDQSQSKDNLIQSQAKSLDDESLKNLAINIGNFETDKLFPVEQIQDWIYHNARMATVDELWQVVLDYRDSGMNDDIMRSFHETAAKSIDNFDQMIIGSLMRSA